MRKNFALMSLAALPLLMPIVAAAQPAGLPASKADSLATTNDPAALLRQAQRSLAAGRTAEAGEWLERAESRVLNRSVIASQAGTPEASGVVGEISAARGALTRRDRKMTESHIGAALTRLAAPTPVAAPMTPMPAAPMTSGAMPRADAMPPMNGMIPARPPAM